MIILGEPLLERILASNAEYYHNERPHLSLEKDTPHGRLIQSPEQGKIVCPDGCVDWRADDYLGGTSAIRTFIGK